MRSADDLAQEDLARSGLTLEQARSAGMYAVADAREAHPSLRALPALVIPYYDPFTGDLMDSTPGESFARVRYLELPPESPVRSFTKPKKPQRYSQPLGSPVRAYFPMVDELNWREVLRDKTWGIIITEGEKKALAAAVHELPCIGLGGVYNFMLDGALLPELAAVDWDGRDVFLCFDSDASANPDIQCAEGRLATELSLKRGAHVRLVRLPKLQGQDKTGLDDFLKTKGLAAFLALVEAAPNMRKVDAAVIGMNAQVAWIERDGLVYDIDSGVMMNKSNFAKGSKHSAIAVSVPTLKGDKQKQLSVAEAWLTHPHARRYADIVFRPEEPREVDTESGRALNMWEGWSPEEGDVSPFLRLSEHVFGDLPAEHHAFGIKWLAFKAQNPAFKVPMALAFVSEETGTGKSLWAECAVAAFEPYSRNVPPDWILQPFNGYLEKTLMCVFDEAEAVHVIKGQAKLRSLITGSDTMLNEKFRVARRVSNYTQYILTSNDLRVAAYNKYDRRMFVVSPRGKQTKDWYDAISTWLYTERGGPKLLNWLLSYDLAGWRPPQTPPMTAEKYMAYMESLSPVQRLAEEMQTASQNTIKMWVDAALQWAAVEGARESSHREAEEIRTALPRLQIRPFYTPEELAMMFPAIVGQLHGAKQVFGTPAGEISRQLREAGIGYLRCSDDPRGFQRHGRLCQYLVIANANEWREPLSQQEFDRVMAQFPTYADVAHELQEAKKRATRKLKGERSQ